MQRAKAKLEGSLKLAAVSPAATMSPFDCTATAKTVGNDEVPSGTSNGFTLARYLAQ